MCQSLYLNKVAVLRPATLLKKRLWHRCFSVNFAKFLRTPFIIEHRWWLLLELEHILKTFRNLEFLAKKLYKIMEIMKIRTSWILVNDI